jgi:hypothetical protein
LLQLVRERILSAPLNRGLDVLVAQNFASNIETILKISGVIVLRGIHEITPPKSGFLLTGNHQTKTKDQWQEAGMARR